jgi:hypothetical protein
MFSDRMAGFETWEVNRSELSGRDPSRFPVGPPIVSNVTA